MSKKTTQTTTHATLQDYLKLKAVFENQQIIFDSGNQKRRDAKIESKKKKKLKGNECIECKKVSQRGTIFEETADHYIARCGSSTPCTLRVMVPKRPVACMFTRRGDLERDIAKMRETLARLHMDAIYLTRDEHSMVKVQEEYHTVRHALDVAKKEYERLALYHTRVLDHRDHDEEVKQIQISEEEALDELIDLSLKGRLTKEELENVVKINTDNIQKLQKRLREIYKPMHNVNTELDTKRNILSVEFQYFTYDVEKSLLPVRSMIEKKKAQT